MTQVQGGRPIGYWLKLVDRLVDESFDHVFHGSGLTRRHWQVLEIVRDGGTDQSTLDSILVPFSGPGGVAPEVDDLVRRGWVRDDGGTIAVTLPGQDAHAELLAKVAASRERLADGITEQEYATTVVTLERMARNLGWSG